LIAERLVEGFLSCVLKVFCKQSTPLPSVMRRSFVRKPSPVSSLRFHGALLLELALSLVPLGNFGPQNPPRSRRSTSSLPPPFLLFNSFPPFFRRFPSHSDPAFSLFYLIARLPSSSRWSSPFLLLSPLFFNYLRMVMERAHIFGRVAPPYYFLLAPMYVSSLRTEALSPFLVHTRLPSLYLASPYNALGVA